MGLSSFEDFGFVVVRTECNYRSPAMFGETLNVGTCISTLKSTSFIFEYEIREGQVGRLVADGLSVQACYDLKLKKTVPIPGELRQRVTEFEGS